METWHGFNIVFLQLYVKEEDKGRDPPHLNPLPQEERVKECDPLTSILSPRRRGRRDVRQPSPLWVEGKEA